MAAFIAKGRNQCPTCGAPRSSVPLCHRCKTDLEPLQHIEALADRLREHARACYGRGWYRRAAHFAGQVVALEPRPEDLRLLACAALFAGDYQTALHSASHAISQTPLGKSTG